MKRVTWFVLLTGLVALKNVSGEESKVHIGVLELESNTGQHVAAQRITNEIEEKLLDMGFYQVHSSEQVETILEEKELRIPDRCLDPRCIIYLGREAGMDRVLSGMLDYNKGRWGIQLQLYDIDLREIIDEVSIEGQVGVDASFLMESAVKRVHGIRENGITRPYFGHHLNNRKQMLYSTSGLTGAAFLYGALNYFIEGGSKDVVFNYRDDPLSGHSSSANQIPMFARPAALGNAYVALSDDAYGVLYNPAGMARVQWQEASFAYQYRFGFDNIAATYVNRATRDVGFGQAIMYSGDRDFGLTEFYFVSALAYRINQLFMYKNPVSVGASLKIASSRVNSLSPDSPGGSSFGLGFDAGFQWQINNKIGYGLLLRDIPLVNRWKNTVTGKRYFESNAATLHMGGSFQAGYATLLIAEGQLPLYEDQPWKMAGGIEQELFRFLALRIGAQKEILQDHSTPWKITGGLGFRIDSDAFWGNVINFDCSYEYNTLDVFNVVNVSMRVGF
ncbi:hypothetical protein QA601_02350 [Chitinispirillales bacterium ANBcel5]|uniref:hypothetical protein n=1 Tax=Cellulosispirillum alkaliphilum TaxID=3039283 RepID=UPI002A50C3B8|nr:hypothetical protein [Chitinispirillales bacterium ANBcel5]